MDYTKKYAQKMEEERDLLLKRVKELENEEENDPNANWVIFQQSGPSTWYQLTAMTGKTPEEAIAKVVEGHEVSGVYMAVPNVYWGRRVDFDAPSEKYA